MMKVFFAVVLSGALLLASCGKQQVITRHVGFESGNVKNLHAGPADADFFYSLPLTVVNIDVEIKKTEYTPGPYARYANRFLGLDDVILSASENHEIKNIKINSFAEPDPDQIYYINLPDDLSQKTYIKMSEAGLIAGISKKPGSSIPEAAYQHAKDFVTHESKTNFNYYVDINLMERIDTIVRYVFEDTATVQQKTYRRSLVEKSTEQRAREVAEHILEIREKKFDLITGFQEIPYSKDALEFMHTELSKLENDYLALFTGITSHSTTLYRFIHRPTKEDAAKEHNLFYFSANKGIIIDSDNNEDIFDGKALNLVYKTTDTGNLLRQKLQQSVETPYPATKGIHYRIPEYAEIDILMGSEVKAKARILINQFGLVNALPAKNLEIDFYPGTGSIKLIGIEKVEEKEQE